MVVSSLNGPPGSYLVQTWTIVITSTYYGTSGPLTYESDGDGGDPRFLTRWTVTTGVILKWCRKWLLERDFETPLMSVVTVTMSVSLFYFLGNYVGGSVSVSRHGLVVVSIQKSFFPYEILSFTIFNLCSWQCDQYVYIYIFVFFVNFFTVVVSLCYYDVVL